MIMLYGYILEVVINWRLDKNFVTAVMKPLPLPAEQEIWAFYASFAKPLRLPE